MRRPLAELVLVATGDVALVFRSGTAFDAVSGQEWIFEVALFEREVEDWKRSTEMPPAPGSPRKMRPARARDRAA